MTKAKTARYNVVRGEIDGQKGWLVTGPELEEPAGVYSTKKEAEEARVGLDQFGKEYAEMFRREAAKKSLAPDDQSFAERKQETGAAVASEDIVVTSDGEEPQSEVETVVTKKTTKKTTTARKKAKPTKAKGAAKPKAAKANGKLSQLDAAAKVLQKAKDAMGCMELVGAMEKQGLWASPGGKTPDRTLYSALTREINIKGKDSRFKKAAKGKFAIAGK